MLIENPESLQSWLEGYLPPLCDAGPEVLARYCLALIRKDRKDEDLKSSMMEALDVFLKDNTNTFVDVFLSVVNSKSYLPKVTAPVSPVKLSIPPLEPISPEHPSEAKGIISALPVTNNMSPISQPPLPTAPPPDNIMPHPPPESPPPPSSPIKKEDMTTNLVKPRKDIDRDDRKRRRSNSRTRSRRSRSRGRTMRNKYDDRRRRSPHSKRYRRTRSRTRSPRRSRSPARRSRSRDRRSRSQKSSSPKRSTRHRTRSRSPFARSLLPVSPSKSPSKDAVDEPNSVEITNDKDAKSGAHHRHSEKFSSSKSQRCRDYDEQGFCMRGDQCPFDHGSDPVVLEGAALEFPPPLSTVSARPTTAYSAPPPPTIVNQEGRPLMPHPPPPRGTHLGEYTPNNPGIWNADSVQNVPIFYGSSRGRGLSGPGSRYTTPHTITPSDIGRELISVPVDSNSHSKGGVRAPLQGLGQIHSNGSFNTLNLKFGDNCTLELKKIPTGMNTIALLNQHFAKFGNITNIQIHHGGDPEAALVTFCNNSEASAAYRSTEAVLNNRFIKIFWHNPHVVLTKGNLVKTVYNSNAVQTQSSEISTAVPDSTQPATVVPKSDNIKKLEIETICKQQELLKAEITAQNKKEKNKAEAMKLKSEVEQRTRQLLEKQMAQVKVLVNKLDINRSNMKPEEKKALVSTIKSLQSAVDATKARLIATPAAPPAAVPLTRSKSQLDKEILDAELELYNVQSEGGDITRLRTRLQQLKIQVGHLKVKVPFPSNFNSNRPVTYPTRGRGFMRGAPRGSRGRGRGHVVNAVDRRTTTIHVSGFEKEDKEDVLTHFSSLATVTNYLWDRHTPSMSVQFATRREAEKVILLGRNLQDRLLTLTWTHSNAQDEAIVPDELPTMKPIYVPDDQKALSTTTSIHDDTEEITEEIIEVEETVDGDEELLLYDDDDESEGRSWRR